MAVPSVSLGDPKMTVMGGAMVRQSIQTMAVRSEEIRQLINIEKKKRKRARELNRRRKIQMAPRYNDKNRRK